MSTSGSAISSSAASTYSSHAGSALPPPTSLASPPFPSLPLQPPALSTQQLTETPSPSNQATAPSDVLLYVAPFPPSFATFASTSSSTASSSTSPAASSGSSQPPVHPSHAALPNAPSQARLLLAYSKVPLATLILRIPPVYVMSRDDQSSQQATQPHAYISLKVRIMGSLQPTLHGHTLTSNRTPASLQPVKLEYREVAASEVFLVAKDLCTLIHTRKGNVAKSIGGFADWEKARMAVLCPRSNGSVSTHILTVLSIAGMYRLLNASRSPLAPVIMEVLYEVINSMLDEETERSTKQAAEGEAVAAAAAAATKTEDASQQQATASPSPASSTSSPATSSSLTSSSSAISSPSSSPAHPSPSSTSPVSHAASATTTFISGATQLDHGDSMPLSPVARASSATPRSSGALKRSRKEERSDDEETIQVSGPVIIYSLVSTVDGVSFVRLNLRDAASVRQELRSVREGAGGIQGADDEQATIDRAEVSYGDEGGRGSVGSGSAGGSGRQISSSRSLSTRPAVVAPAVALPAGFERPTVAALAVKVDEQRDGDRWRLQQSTQLPSQRDERGGAEESRGSLDAVLQAYRVPPSAVTLSSSSSASGPLVSGQLPGTALQQLHQLQFQQLQQQQQQQQQQLMAAQQQQQQQHKRDEMMLLLRQQQQQHQLFMREAQRLLTPQSAAQSRPAPSMSPNQSAATPLYSPFSSVASQPLPLSLSSDFLQPPPSTLLQPANASASLPHSALQSSSLGPSSFNPVPFPSPFPFVQPLGPGRPPTVPPQPLPLDWLLGGGAAGSSGANGNGGNGGGGGSGSSTGYNSGGFSGYGQQGGSGYSGYQ